MAEKLYLYPIWLRIWHAINALMFLVLLVTGISLQYSNPDFVIIRFDYAVTYHNLAGIILSFNYLIFLFGNFSTGNSRFYKLQLKGLIEKLIKQANYYLNGTFKGEHTPFPVNKNRKFNPLQKVAYVATMFVMIPVMIITGIALLFPETIIENVFNLSGIYLTALLHGIVSVFLLLFLVIHLYFSTMGKTPSSNFKSIVNGYHEPH
ncbi:MAG: cytochrome b/b6 domain-containing protein [Bacteroidetes bacterium]|jgi:thiosulfate reductase cytochrome b subunit|nr:cytochrome b/b6 domain-containing protein [Bacteroidota bacterium]